MDAPSLSTFRQRVEEVVAADLARQAEDARSLRADVLRRLRSGLEDARRQGMCAEVWLFGSFAWGLPGAESDVDLMATGCADPDGLSGFLWRYVDRPVHVVTKESAPESLVSRVLSEGEPL